MTVREVIALHAQHGISGLPVVEGKRVVGIVTNRDLRFETNLDEPVTRHHDAARAARHRAAKAPSLDEAKALMHKHRLERVLVVNDDVRAARADHRQGHPEGDRASRIACKDELGRLRVGAAVGVGDDTEERVEALVAAGVDVIVVDTAHGHSQGVLDRVRGSRSAIRRCRSSAATSPPAARRAALVDAGADGVKVGIGPGSICTTRIVAGVGVPQITRDRRTSPRRWRHAACR